MPYGYTGKILRVDLTTGKIGVDEHDEYWYRTYMGGALYAAWYMLHETPPGVDPLGPDNMMVFANSPIVGAPAAGFNRLTVCARSPLTSGFGEAHTGGFTGPELKFAGFDAVVITGKAEKPVYLWIHDGECEIRDASHLWGMLTADAEEAIRSELDDAQIKYLGIGPGGEKMVRYACVIDSRREAAGRTGMGAVMGSKNLKCLAIRGTQGINMLDGKFIIEKAKWFARNYMDNPDNYNLATFGTAVYIASQSERGMQPTRNFHKGSFDEVDKISGETMRETILVDTEGCYACPVKCKRVVEIKEGPFKADPKYGGPEYETLASMGSYCEVSDLAAISAANQLCNAYSVDTISCGNTVGFAMELYENGILTKEDTGGVDLTWGNAEGMYKMVEMICKREGIGKDLGEGTARFAKKWGKGAGKYAMQVKAEEIAMHEPRFKGMLGITYAVSELGADHTRVEHDPDFDFIAPDTNVEQAKVLGLLERLPNPTIDWKKMRMYYYLQHHFSMLDVLGGCLLTFAPVRTFTMTDLVLMTNAITGWETSLWELMKLGERRWNLVRLYNIREGFAKEDDWLPDRMFEGIENGPEKGRAIDPKAFREAIDLYYEMCNWDEDAVPRISKLVELDLMWAAEKEDEWVAAGKDLRAQGNLDWL